MQSKKLPASGAPNARRHRRGEKLPRYVVPIADRHGGPPFLYFRRTGRKLIPLPRDYGSAEFWAAYGDACAGRPQDRTKPPIARVKRGTFEAMMNSHLGSEAFRKLVRQDQRLTAFRQMREMGVSEWMVAETKKRDVKRILDKVAETHPGTSRILQATFNILFDEAEAQELIDVNPIKGMKRAELTGPGRVMWPEEAVEQYRKHHKIGTVARLALELMLYTALRCVDAYRVGPGTGTILPDGTISLLQSKIARKVGERARVTIPVHENLRAALDAIPVRSTKTWLTTVSGKPFSSASELSHQFARWCDEAGLEKQYRAHGLRKACACRLIDAGVSVADAAAITGHLDVKELMEYAAARDKRIGAARGIAALG